MCAKPDVACFLWQGPAIALRSIFTSPYNTPMNASYKSNNLFAELLQTGCLEHLSPITHPCTFLWPANRPVAYRETA